MSTVDFSSPVQGNYCHFMSFSVKFRKRWLPDKARGDDCASDPGSLSRNDHGLCRHSDPSDLQHFVAGRGRREPVPVTEIEGRACSPPLPRPSQAEPTALVDRVHRQQQFGLVFALPGLDGRPQQLPGHGGLHAGHEDDFFYLNRNDGPRQAWASHRHKTSHGEHCRGMFAHCR